MNKMEVVNKLRRMMEQSDFYSTDIKESFFRNKLFVVTNCSTVERYFKTNKGAEGYIKKQSNITYYDEYSMELTNCGTNLEITMVTYDEVFGIKNVETTPVSEENNTTSEMTYAIEESKHTKTNEVIFLVKFENKLSKAEFIELNNKIKSLGGYYSKFTHSFVFKEDPTQILTDNFKIEVAEETDNNTVVEINETESIEQQEEIKPTLETIELINIADKDVFVNCLVPSINKNDTVECNNKEIEESSILELFKLNAIIKMDLAQYNYFTNNLLSNYDFFKKELNTSGGWEQDENGKFLYTYGIAIVCDNQETIIIDAEGYSYARYCCKLEQDINGSLQAITDIKYTNTTNVKIDSVVNNGLYPIYADYKTIKEDETIIYYDEDCKPYVTGKRLKELIKQGKSINLNKSLTGKVKDIEYFADRLLRIDMGLIQEIFPTQEKKDLMKIKFSERLKEQLKN